MAPSTTPDPVETGRAFAELAGTLHAEPERVPQAVVEWAVRVIPGCDHASLMIRRGEDDFVTLAASDEVAAGIDGFERALRDGPCVDAILDDGCQHDADLTDDPTWPTLAARVVAETPVRSALGFRIVEGGRKRGAIDLFADRTHVFDDAAVEQAAVLAAFASVALAAAEDRERAANLEQALDSNREIGKAIGLLMAAHSLSDADAFAVLRQTSQTLNRKLRDIAAELVAKSAPATAVGTPPGTPTATPAGTPEAAGTDPATGPAD